MRPIRLIYRHTRAIYSRYRLKGLIRKKLAKGEPIRVVLGANKKFQKGWVSTEIYSLNISRPEDWRRYFPEESIEMLSAEHVWEHLSREEGIFAAELSFKYLKPGGHLRVAVPDGLFPDPSYIECVRPGGTGPSAQYHKILYTYQPLKEVFEKAGFRVNLLEYYDENGKFHSKDWNSSDGMISRSKKVGMYKRRFGDLQYSSLMLDAIKPS